MTFTLLVWYRLQNVSDEFYIHSGIPQGYLESRGIYVLLGLTPVTPMELKYFFPERLKCVYIFIPIPVKKEAMTRLAIHDLASRYCKAQ